jgi:hypothetical protein
MDTVLIVLTCASVAAAAAFGISAWRSRAEEARRSAARVAALTAAIDGGEPVAFDEAATFAAPPPTATPAFRPVAVTSMFATSPGASVRGLPLVKMGVFGALALVFLVVIAMANRDRAEAPASAGSADAMLELVSMKHARDGRGLTITGLVRNPRTGVPRSNIDAIVSAFDRNGALVTSGDAGLDFTNLAPGDESPFVVTLRDASGVARYRVSFRTGTSTLRHVDRRADALQASAQ